jgi:1,4-alpha-glucan branching enzyme
MGAVKSLFPVLILIVFLTGCASSTPFQSPAGSPRDVTFRYEDKQARKVEVAGSFNNWNPNSTPMKKKDGAAWTVTVKLEPGPHQYMFVVDGKKWVRDPGSPLTVSDGFGRINSLVIVE